MPAGVNAYWPCPTPKCRGFIPDETVVAKETEEKLSKLRAASDVGALTTTEYHIAEVRLLEPVRPSDRAYKVQTWIVRMMPARLRAGGLAAVEAEVARAAGA